ncbi:MAG: metallophosphoesterase [Acidobacteria bacterium]|nr:metallophosphoesterase [Acidobacteriota bacterium]MBI3281485.1 metallophosphoesterase [Acidobacteriota bacterium]
MRSWCLVLLLLAAWRPAPAADDVFTRVEKVVAIGDLHGDYEQFLVVLRAAGLVDARAKWIGGRAHLVQTGDVLDRGPDSRNIMDLLIELATEARRAGGQVHALIGNHETMNLIGDLRYTSPAEFDSFRTNDSETVRQKFYRRRVVHELRQPESDEPPPKLDDDYRKQWEARHPLGYFEHRMSFAPDGKYGRWIRGNNAILKINDTLFLHGGISPKYRAYSVREINEEVRRELRDFNRLPGGFVLDSEGPLWYRGLATEDETLLGNHVDGLLATYGVNRIVIGHTITGSTILPRFGGKVVMIDVGLSKVYGGPPAGLVLEKGTAYALHRGELIPLPGPGTSVLDYLKQVAELEPANSPFRRKAMEVGASR